MIWAATPRASGAGHAWSLSSQLSSLALFYSEAPAELWSAETLLGKWHWRRQVKTALEET